MSKRYDRTWFPSEGLNMVKKDGKYGFIQIRGTHFDRRTEIIPPIYEDADHFLEGLAKVKKDGKWGYIDETGKVVIPFEFDEAGRFHNGHAKVKKDDQFLFIDKMGVRVIDKPLKGEKIDLTLDNSRLYKELQKREIDGFITENVIRAYGKHYNRCLEVGRTEAVRFNDTTIEKVEALLKEELNKDTYHEGRNLVGTHIEKNYDGFIATESEYNSCLQEVESIIDDFLTN